MRHLTDQQLLECAEDHGAPAATHLASCERCRVRVGALRDTLKAAREVEVPEPSPLFWEHFSARVRAAVAAEPPPVVSAWQWTWQVGTGVAAALALAVAVLVTRPGTPVDAPDSRATGAVRPNVVQTADRAADKGSVVGDAVDAQAADADVAALRLLGDLAADLDWDTAAQAGIAVDDGAADAALAELSVGERLELRRLLNEAMSSSAGVL